MYKVLIVDRMSVNPIGTFNETDLSRAKKGAETYLKKWCDIGYNIVWQTRGRDNMPVAYIVDDCGETLDFYAIVRERM
jgi:hypothetical protein